MSTQISIVNVNDYDNVKEAIIAAIKMIETNLQFEFYDAKSILIKPNLLMAEKNACTQPIFVEGVIEDLKEVGVSLENVRKIEFPWVIGEFKYKQDYLIIKM